MPIRRLSSSTVPQLELEIGVEARASDWQDKPRRQRPIEPSSSQHQKQIKTQRNRIPAKGPPSSRRAPHSYSSSPSPSPSPSAFSTSTSFFPFPKFGKTGAFATFFPLRCFFLALSSSTSSSTSSSCSSSCSTAGGVLTDAARAGVARRRFGVALAGVPGESPLASRPSRGERERSFLL